MKRQLEALNEITRQALSNKDDFWKVAEDSMETMLQGTATRLSELVATGASRTVEDLAFRLEGLVEAVSNSLRRAVGDEVLISCMLFDPAQEIHVRTRRITGSSDIRVCFNLRGEDIARIRFRSRKNGQHQLFPLSTMAQISDATFNVGPGEYAVGYDTECYGRDWKGESSFWV